MNEMERLESEILMHESLLEPLSAPAVCEAELVRVKLAVRAVLEADDRSSCSADSFDQVEQVGRRTDVRRALAGAKRAVRSELGVASSGHWIGGRGPGVVSRGQRIALRAIRSWAMPSGIAAMFALVSMTVLSALNSVGVGSAGVDWTGGVASVESFDDGTASALLVEIEEDLDDLESTMFATAADHWSVDSLDTFESTLDALSGVGSEIGPSFR
jgi:hypothetical protein